MITDLLVKKEEKREKTGMIRWCNKMMKEEGRDEARDDLLVKRRKE